MKNLFIYTLFFLISCKQNYTKVKEDKGNGFFCEYQVDKNSLKQGEYIVYYKKDNKNIILEKYNFKNDSLDGLVIINNDQGNVFRISNYSKGKKNGVTKIFFPFSNQIEEEVNYKNGLMDGVYKRYYSNGNTMLTGFHIDGLRDSTFQTYHEDGSLIGIRNHKNGKLDGFSYLFKSNLDTILLKKYKEDKLIELIDLSENNIFGKVQNGEGYEILNHEALKIVYSNGVPVDTIKLVNF